MLRTLSASNDAELRALHERGAYAECLTAALARYGDELRGFTRARLDDGEVAEPWAEICAAWVEGLPRFQWRSSLRTWLYQVARHTLIRHRERRRTSHLPLSQVPEPIAPAPSEVPSFLGDRAQAQLQRIRAGLDDEDRSLLYLRIDRGLDWREVAAALAEPGADEEELVRRSAALRKRFERLKAQLKAELSEALAQAVADPRTPISR